MKKQEEYSYEWTSPKKNKLSKQDWVTVAKFIGVTIIFFVVIYFSIKVDCY